MWVCCLVSTFVFYNSAKKKNEVLCLIVLFAAINFSFTLASEVLLTLEFMVTSIHMFLNRSLGENGKDTCTGFSKEIIPFLCKKLGSYAQKLLMHKCDRDDVGGSLKTKVSLGSYISNMMD